MLPGIRSGLGLRHSPPPGYGWAVAGLAIFAVSGVGDLTWHLFIGIEQNIAALLSPTHLGLLGGAMLIVTAPWRSARADPDLNPRPSLSRILPAVLTFILASIFLFGPLLLLLRTWVLPRGAALVVVGLQCVLMQSQTGFADGGLAVLGVVGAIAVEGLVLLIRPKPDDRARLQIFFLLAPPLFWAVYVLGILLADGHLGWKAELWGGSLAWSGLTMLALATVVTMAPPVIEHQQVPNALASPDQIASLQGGEAIRAETPDPAGPLSSGTS